MNWNFTPESSNLAGFGYDEINLTLIVEFKNGTSYHYFSVPIDVFNAMCVASSKGTFLAQNVKGIYNYQKV